MRAHRAAILGGICFSLLAAAMGPAAFAQSPARAPTVEQLQAELERRDAVISDLLQRVQALEQRLGGAAPSRPAPTASAPAAPQARNAAEEADEALLERALERSLVLSGGALLPRGSKEVEPSLSYGYTQRSGLAVLGNSVVSRNYRREDFGAGLAFRAGLPWSSQLDLALPFAYQRVESVVDGVANRSTASGVGDVQIALTHQFLNERDSRFALLGGVSWLHSNRTSSLRPLVLGLPDFASPAAVGSGHDAFAARLTATKRIDPLVFVGSLSHSWGRAETVEGASVRTGAADGVILRAILAASPEVSLRTGLALTRTGKTRINGIGIEGTRTTATIAEIGTSVVLDRNRLLDLSLGIGLTAESPDFVFALSMPIRF
jgi:hypothetical protein